MIDTGVVHGRFQVFHNDHLKYVQAGKSLCKHLVIGITNPDPTLTRDDPSNPGRSNEANNPLTYFERYTLVRQALSDADISPECISIVPLPINFPELYRYYVPLDAVFFLTIYDDWGRRKLKQFTSMNLQTNVLWERPTSQKKITGTHIRKQMAENGPWEALVPLGVAKLLKQWRIPERLRQG